MHAEFQRCLPRRGSLACGASFVAERNLTKDYRSELATCANVKRLVVRQTIKTVVGIFFLSFTLGGNRGQGRLLPLWQCFAAFFEITTRGNHENVRALLLIVSLKEGKRLQQLFLQLKAVPTHSPIQSVRRLQSVARQHIVKNLGRVVISRIIQ